MTRAVVPMGPILRCEPFAGWLRSVTSIYRFTCGGGTGSGDVAAEGEEDAGGGEE
jgi:hypothetical protein